MHHHHDRSSHAAYVTLLDLNVSGFCKRPRNDAWHEKQKSLGGVILTKRTSTTKTRKSGYLLSLTDGGCIYSGRASTTTLNYHSNDVRKTRGWSKRSKLVSSNAFHLLKGVDVRILPPKLKGQAVCDNKCGTGKRFEGFVGSGTTRPVHSTNVGSRGVQA